MTYSPYDNFPPNPRKGWDSHLDGDYDFRAWVRYDTVAADGKSVAVVALFPPAHLATTDSKYDFTRNLTAYLADMKTRVTLKSVDVHQGNSKTPLYSVPV